LLHYPQQTQHPQSSRRSFWQNFGHGDDLKVSPPTEQYSPAALRAAVLALREDLRRQGGGEDERSR
jgi:hypothetical protein